MKKLIGILSGARAKKLLAALTIIVAVIYIGLYVLVFKIGEYNSVATFITYSPLAAYLLPLTLLLAWSILIKHKLMICLHAAIAIVYAFAILGFNVPHFSRPNVEGKPLRVLTYNIHSAIGGAGDIVRLIMEHDPDVICIQEGNRYKMDMSMPIPGFIESFPYQSARYGELITISKYPILKSDIPMLSQKQGGRALRTVIDVNGTEIAVINAHPTLWAYPRSLAYALKTGSQRVVRGYLKQTAAIRAEQFDSLERLIDSTRQPTIICGDFNTPPRGKIYPRMLKTHVDSFAEAGWGFGYSYMMKGIPVFRIDYIFAPQTFGVKSCAIPYSRLSDHRPVVADLVIPK